VVDGQVSCESLLCTQVVQLYDGPCAHNSDCSLHSCFNSICQGASGEGGVCTTDSDCQMNFYCSSTFLCEPKYTVKAGQTCQADGQCIGPLLVGSPLCLNNICVNPQSVSNGGACNANPIFPDFQCQLGSACLGGKCSSQIGNICSNDSVCGFGGSCTSCSGSNPVCQSASVTAPSQCQTLLTDWQTAISSLSPDDSQRTDKFLFSYQPFINLICCLDCTKDIPGFFDFTGISAVSGSILNSLDNFNLNCDPGSQVVQPVGEGQLCCDSQTAGNCGRTVSGCTQFLASGVTVGLSKNAAIGIGVGVGVGGLLIIIGLIALCYCCCCKKKPKD